MTRTPMNRTRRMIGNRTTGTAIREAGERSVERGSRGRESSSTGIGVWGRDVLGFINRDSHGLVFGF